MNLDERTKFVDYAIASFTGTLEEIPFPKREFVNRQTLLILKDEEKILFSLWKRAEKEYNNLLSAITGKDPNAVALDGRLAYVAEVAEKSTPEQKEELNQLREVKKIFKGELDRRIQEAIPPKILKDIPDTRLEPGYILVGGELKPEPDPATVAADPMPAKADPSPAPTLANPSF